MRKIITTLAVLAGLAVAGFGPGVAHASAASCVPSGAGGEKVPALIGTTDVTETGTQGYKCTVAWQAEIVPKYESGGVWHEASEVLPAFHPNIPDYKVGANVAYSWPNGPHPTDFDWDFSGFNSAELPVCSVNWELEVNLFRTDGFVFQSDISPELHKTC